jgi:hypothetical protein
VRVWLSTIAPAESFTLIAVTLPRRL